MTVAENLARLFPLHYQRIVEITHETGMEDALEQQSIHPRNDLAEMFVWYDTTEGDDYWRALATGEGYGS